jgi:hypothetical protein
MDPRKPEKPSDKLQLTSGVAKPTTVSSALKTPSISPELSRAYCSRVAPLRGTPLVITDSDAIPGYIHSHSTSSDPFGTPFQRMSGMMAVDPEEDVMGSAPSSPFIGRSKKNRKSLKFRPSALNMAQVALAAPDRKAASLHQRTMEEHMSAGFGNGSGAAAGSVADSMDLGNYNGSAPENMDDNPQWDAEHLPLFLAQEREQRDRHQGIDIHMDDIPASAGPIERSVVDRIKDTFEEFRCDRQCRDEAVCRAASIVFSAFARLKIASARVQDAAVGSPEYEAARAAETSARNALEAAYESSGMYDVPNTNGQAIHDRVLEMEDRYSNRYSREPPRQQQSVQVKPGPARPKSSFFPKGGRRTRRRKGTTRHQRKRRGRAYKTYRKSTA